MRQAGNSSRGFGQHGLCLAVLLLAMAEASSTHAQTRDRLANDGASASPALALQSLRFVTDTDYPPFNYYNEEGTLSGFNVDLARALCDELQVTCAIEVRDWPDLVPAVEKGQADAVIASLAISASALDRLAFTTPYYRTPARFVSRRDDQRTDLSPAALAGTKIAVVSGTAHEAFLKDFFAEAEIIAFPSLEASRTALQTGTADLLFGDGIGLMFWLNGTLAQGCCAFRGGPYLEARYFSEGVGIGVAQSNTSLRDKLDEGLEKVRLSGRYEALFLRYFPLSFY